MAERARVADVASGVAMGVAAGTELVFAQPSAAADLRSERRLRGAGAPAGGTGGGLLAVSAALALGGEWSEEENAAVFVAALAAYSVGAHGELRPAVLGLTASVCLVARSTWPRAAS